jgi:hypothetical protein
MPASTVTRNTQRQKQQIFLIAGKYMVTAEQHGDVDVMTFLYTSDPQIHKAYIPATERYLDLYSRLIGPYPYQKFALVENFWQTGTGCHVGPGRRAGPGGSGHGPGVRTFGNPVGGGPEVQCGQG